jgi:adenylate cyclase
VLSLVVLPFDNVGGEPADSYLVTGITDDLTTALSHIPGTFVVSRATAYTYRGKSEDIRQTGQDLNVRYIVRGSVRRQGQILRVNAELGSTETGAQLWSDSFDQTTSDLAAGQEQIVIRMSVALNISLVDIEAARVLRERPTNPDAFDLILRARATESLPQTKDTTAKVLELYDQALQRDPDAVLALTGGANAPLRAYFLDAVPYRDAMNRAVRYLDRAQAVEPNGESVLITQSQVLDFQLEGLDHRHALAGLKAVAQKLVDLYPNNPTGYFRLGVAAREEGKYDEAAQYFATAIRLNPRSPQIRNLYWNMAFCSVWGGRDQEGLEWANRAIGAAGDLPAWRLRTLFDLRIAAHVRTGDIETAKRLATDLNDRYPFATWREHAPDDPGSQQARERAQSFIDALRAAGMRDHVDPDADFGVAPDDVLHAELGTAIRTNTLAAGTPTTAPGVTTLSTAQLAGILQDRKPLVIDTMAFSWYRSIPRAVGLEFTYENLQGNFTDETQKRIEQKLRKLTGGDMTKPIVAMGWNSVSFDGYDLALRLRHAGYTNVYWYRGGREAWEVAGIPEAVVRPADW